MRLSGVVTLAAVVAAAACSDVTRPTAPNPSSIKPAGHPASASITPGVVSGPVFPAPGGTDWVPSGDPNSPSGLVWTYTGIDPTQFATLAWLPTAMNFSMDGTERPLTFDAAHSTLDQGVAVWMGTSPVPLAGGGSTNVNIRVTLRATDLNGAAEPLVSTSDPQATTAGLPTELGVAYFVTGTSFRLNITSEAQHPSVNGGQFAPFSSVFDALMTSPDAANHAVSELSGGFFYTFAPCQPGKYYDGTGCVPAAPGSYSPGGTVTSATPCDAGFFQPLAGQGACVPAPAGSFVANTGAIAATPCDAGYFTSSPAMTACVAAPAGTYVETVGATGPTDCQAGKYQPSTGQTSCSNAEAGYYVATPESALETPCAPGSYNPYVGAVSCLSAPAGSFVDKPAATTATLCPAGFFTSTTGAIACTPAPVGSYVATAGATSATLCPTGTTTFVTGSTACEAETPQVIATQLTTSVQSLVSTGTLTSSEGSSLGSSLDNAVQAYQRGNSTAGANQMHAFINKVEALQRSHRLSAADAAALIAAANQVIAAGA